MAATSTTTARQGTSTIDADGNVTTAIFERFTFDDTGRDVPDGSLTIGSD